MRLLITKWREFREIDNFSTTVSRSLNYVEGYIQWMLSILKKILVATQMLRWLITNRTSNISTIEMRVSRFLPPFWRTGSSSSTSCKSDGFGSFWKCFTTTNLFALTIFLKMFAKNSRKRLVTCTRYDRCTNYNRYCSKVDLPFVGERIRKSSLKQRRLRKYLISSHTAVFITYLIIIPWTLDDPTILFVFFPLGLLFSLTTTTRTICTNLDCYARWH